MNQAKCWIWLINNKWESWEEARESYRLTSMTLEEFKKYLKARAEEA